VELKVRMALDRLLYFQDAWNFLTYKKFGTVWGQYPVGPVFLGPRENQPDPEGDFMTTPMAARFPPYKEAAELAILRGWADTAYLPKRGPDGAWQPKARAWNEFRDNIQAAFPAALKPRTLVLLSRDCPFYVEKLSQEDRERYELVCLTSVQQWTAAGYGAFAYGDDFAAEDYGDRIHLTSAGGAKLAKLTAGQVRTLSQKLGYKNP
jgi:hypothetical protein